MTEELIRIPKTDNNRFGIYIHWPFCLSKCPYCDFYKEVCKDIPQSKLVAEYIEDLNFYRQLTNDKKVTSIFFGGGTPSLMDPKSIEKILDHIHNLWPTSANLEISLEANPNSNKPHLFSDLKQAGINRLSLGVQALNDSDLKFLGRTHNTQQALNAIDEVLNTFDNHSLDLIYARPNQKMNEWKKELEQSAKFGFKHISLYQLTIEDGTVFAKKELKPLDDDAAVDMYNYTEQYLSENGYPKYEVSNFAPKKYRCRHNLLYWEGDDYIGIGKSAHGRFISNDKIYASVHPRIIDEVPPYQRAEELIIMGLRLTEGINKRHFRKQCGLYFNDFIKRDRLAELKKEGYLGETPTRVFATEKGFPVLNKIIEELCI